MCILGLSHTPRAIAPLGSTYVVTGTTPGGKRIKITTTSRMHAFGINLWRGTVWVIENGKRRALKRVCN